MRTGIYVRVSTEEQAKEGYSIRAQIEKLTDYAKLMDWIIYDIYKDEGLSGKDLEGRPEVQRLMKDIENRKVNNILVFKIDRLTRSTKNLIELVDFFNAHNCGFNSLLESIDTNSATGRMFIKIIGIFAEFERENLIERVKVGNARKAKEGYTMACGIISYGYSRKQGEKIQSIYPEEAEIVKEIFRLYVIENYSLTQISHLLNAKGIPTKRNSKWNTKTVKLIITNPNYIGKVRYQVHDEIQYSEYDGLHEPILDERIFYEAQDKINRMNKIVRTKHVKSDAYFTSIAVCEKCGSKFTPKRSYKRKGEQIISYPGYRCLDYVKGLCNNPTISHLKLEKAFIDYLDRYEDLNDIDENDLNEEPDVNVYDCQKEIEDIEKAISKHKIRSSEIMDLYINQTIDFVTYQEMVKKVKERLYELDIRYGELKNIRKEPNASTINFEEIVRNIKENWLYLNNDEKLSFLHKFVRQIVVGTRGEGKDKIAVIKKLVFNNNENY